MFIINIMICFSSDNIDTETHLVWINRSINYIPACIKPHCRNVYHNAGITNISAMFSNIYIQLFSNTFTRLDGYQDPAVYFAIDFCPI